MIVGRKTVERESKKDSADLSYEKREGTGEKKKSRLQWMERNKPLKQTGSGRSSVEKG